MWITNPLSMPFILLHVGVLNVMGWFRHFAMMALYTLLHQVSRPPTPSRLNSCSLPHVCTSLYAPNSHSASDFGP
jgi:hypothetical protein